MADWENYYKVHAHRKPREQVVRAVALCADKSDALDLGAGTLVESNYFLDQGFRKVTAVDSSENAQAFAESLDPKRFTLKICSFQEFEFRESAYDLISALYSLPFNGPEDFEKLFYRIKASLKPNGIFVGQLFGTRDGLNEDDTKLVFQSKAEALELFKGLELVEFEEDERDESTAEGTAKHWHVFHFIARKSA
jgi:SAM-dependent methyltransferase